MLSKDKEMLLISMFIELDNFCQALHSWQLSTGRYRHPTRVSSLCDSELMSICVFYHYSGYKCFEYYYRDFVCKVLASYYPNLVSYERFLSYLVRIMPGLFVFLQLCTLKSRATGLYFIDSKKLVVCDNHRIHSNKVFAGVAARGKSSTGWFYGLKIHLVINNLGEIMNFALTKGDVADNNAELLQGLLKDLKGECYGDKGYITKLFEAFYEKGLSLITKVRKNMKNKLLPIEQKLKLRKRAVIESVNDILTSVLDIEHTRHRNPYNAVAHILAGLVAYCFYPNKPSVYVNKNENLLLVA
jgi:hypothetical protein